MAWENTWTALDADGNVVADPGVEYPTEVPDGGSWRLDGTQFVADATGAQDKYTADAVAGETGVDNSSSLEELRAAQAKAAGVQDARYAGYAEVLANYANRSDVETLAERRARHLGYDPAQQSFTRAADYDAGAGTADEPQTEYPDVTAAWTEDDHSG